MYELLKEHNLKVTNNRIEILNIINDLKVDASIKNIIQNTNMDVSTVYRILNTLEKNNIIDKIVNEDDIVYLIKEEHKHYFKCVKCHQMIEIDTCPFEHYKMNGFKILSHSLILDGICDKCQK